MSMEPKEHLSQLMDGEIGGDTGRFVLRRLEASFELRQTWARYHLIRDCLRRQEWGLGASGLSSRVREAIDAPAESGKSARIESGREKRWLRPAAGFAVAATVAFMAVFTVAPYLSTGANDPVTQTADAAAESFSSPNIPGTGPVTRPVSLSGSAKPEENRLRAYILRHYQVAGASGRNGFVSFVPIVAMGAAPATPEETTPEPKPESDSEEESTN